jgi:hypothetical protein
VTAEAKGAEAKKKRDGEGRIGFSRAAARDVDALHSQNK